MSSMLEQAIVDAAALREAALKNAEQAIIEKYAPQIKEAVDSMLENEASGNGWSQNQLVQHEGRFARITTEGDEGKVGIQYIGEDKTSLVMESELEAADEALLQEEEAAAAAPAAAGGDAGGEAEADDAPVDIHLSEVGDKKVDVIKAVRAITGLGLKDAKAMVDEAPSVIKEGVNKAEADEHAKALQDAGATVELK